MPWTIIGVCYVVCPLLLLLIRALLARENARRDREPPDDTYDDVWLEVVLPGPDGDGKRVRRRVDKEFLDLTDRQNRDFRYVL